jgi:NAD(P)H dehydrogenase (quinone)
MQKPRTLVTAATGRTGFPVALQLLERGFPVRAFVHGQSDRTKQLKQAGAEIFVGNLLDFRDLHQALQGVQRAYYCPPFAPNLLHGSMLFALAAEDAKLEVVALMSQWNSHATHPSYISREHWIANHLYRWMPSVDVVHINPGIFAFVYLLGLPMITHFGWLMAPFGEGRNAPPSNEDIARVAAGVLINPSPHVGKSYRPTGPDLLSTHDMAKILSKILDRQVKYHDTSPTMFAKAAKAFGFPDFETAQMRYYADDIRHGSFEIGTPTDHVELITEQKPESFEETAYRYLQNPTLIHPRLAHVSKLGAIALLVRTLFSRVPDWEEWESEHHHPLLKQPQLAGHNPDWVTSAQQQQLNLLQLNN